MQYDTPQVNLEKFKTFAPWTEYSFLLISFLIEPGSGYAALLYYITQHATGRAQESSGNTGGWTFPHAVRWVSPRLTPVQQLHGLYP